MVAVCKDVPTDKSPVTDVVGAVIAKVPSVAFDIDSPLPNEISFPVTVRSPAIPIEELFADYNSFEYLGLWQKIPAEEVSKRKVP